MIRTQIPKFRLPESRDRRGVRLHPRSRRRVPRRPAHRQPEGAAGRRLRRDLRRLRRAARPRPRHSRPQGSGREHPYRHRLALHRCRSATSARSASASIVLGGGNTAMDCCRSSRRLGGEDVNVVVRSGFEEMKASPWEKEDAMHEGIPILNFLVPKEFTHDNGKPHRHGVREGQGRVRRQGPPQAGADRRAGPAFPLRRRAGRGRPGERLSLDRARYRHRVRRLGHAQGRRDDLAVDATRRCSSAATPRSARRTSSGRWRTATRPRCRSTSCCNGEDVADRPLPAVELVSQKMGIHEWSYDNDISLDQRFKVPLRDKVVALQGHQGRGRARLRRRSSRFKEAQRCLNCDVQTVFTRAAVHRMRCLRRHLPDGLHHLHRRTARKPSCARGSTRRPRTSTQDLYVADGLKTGRVMAKDEDVCLHCGLCAERCPTGAWDMKKFFSR